MFDAIVVGGGPAGPSTAVAPWRVLRETLVPELGPWS